jgi:benzoate-CoA ligase family protein
MSEETGPVSTHDRLNIAELFLTDRVREGDGDRVALRLDDRTLTYAEVDALADRYASALRYLGVRSEERVFVALPDGPDFVGALFGALKHGAVPVMVNPHQPVEAFAGIVAYAGARMAIVSAEVVDMAEEAAAIADAVLPLLVVGAGRADMGAGGDRGVEDRHGSGEVAAIHYLDDLPAGGPVDVAPTHPDDPALWLFSGGTTGTPKAVVQTHRSFANTTRRYTEAVGYARNDTTLSVPKLYFGYATGCNLFFPFSVGASAVLFEERSTPEAVFSRIAVHRPTILINVPSMMQAMLDHPDAATQDLSSLRFATSAGEALPPALYERWQAAFGVEVLDGLGTAEMWHIFVSNLPGDVRPGTLGKPIPGFRVEVRDDEGSPVADGEVGKLWVAGDSRGIGYWRDMARTKQVFRGEWVVTGDLVRRDADGYLSYVGRGDDAIKVKGKWLVPAEVEGVLGDHPEVTSAVVVGAPDASGLIKPAAFVTVTEPRDGLEEDLQRWVIERLDAYKHPRVIEVVDELPRTHLGKVNRTVMKDRARDRLTAAAGPEEQR